MKLSSSDLNQESARRLSGSPKISNITSGYWLSVIDSLLDWAVLIYLSQIPWCPKP